MAKKLSELPDPTDGGVPSFIFSSTDLRDGMPVYFTRETVGRSLTFDQVYSPFDKEWTKVTQKS